MTLETVPAGELFYGFPIFVLTYRDEHVGWNMTVCSSSFALREAMVFGLRATGGAAAQIKRAGECTLSVVSRLDMPIVEKLGRLHGTVVNTADGTSANASGNVVGVDKIAAVGAHTETLPGSDLKYLASAQLVFDLEIENTHDALKERIFTARIRGQYADARLLRPEGEGETRDGGSGIVGGASLEERKKALSHRIEPVLFAGADHLIYKYFSTETNHFGDFRKGE